MSCFTRCVILYTNQTHKSKLLQTTLENKITNKDNIETKKITLISSMSAPHFSRSIRLIATFSPDGRYLAAITTAVAP